MMRSPLLLAATAVVALGAAALPVPAQVAADKLPEGPGKSVVVDACLLCHDATNIVLKRRTSEEWDGVVHTMVERGAMLDDDHEAEVLAYLKQNFGTDGAAAASAPGAVKPD